MASADAVVGNLENAVWRIGHDLLCGLRRRGIRIAGRHPWTAKTTNHCDLRWTEYRTVQCADAVRAMHPTWLAFDGADLEKHRDEGNSFESLYLSSP